MKRLGPTFVPVPLIVASALAFALACEPPPMVAVPPPTSAVVRAAGSSGAHYPVAPRGNVVDDLHGTKVADPYRWLEQLDSPETRAWVQAENRVTDEVLGRSPEALRSRIETLTNVEVVSRITRHGARSFWMHNTGTQDQSVLFTGPAGAGAGAGAAAAGARVLVEPNVLSPDGKLAMHDYVVTSDGARLAYGLAIGGGDWQKWRFIDVATGQDLPDELSSIKYYPPVFSGDGKGIYYARFPAPAAGAELSETDHDCKVYFHALGEPAAKDVIVYERPDHPTWQFRPKLASDGRLLVLEIGDGEVGDRGVEQLAVLDLGAAGKPVAVSLVDSFDAEYIFLGSDGPLLYVQTTLGAPKKRIVAIDTRTPGRDHWKEIVPATDNAIADAHLVGRQLIVSEVKDAHAAVVAYDLSGKKVRNVTLPGLGSVRGFRGDLNDKETTYSFESFTSPNVVYRYDVATGVSTPWRTPALSFDPAAFETTQVFYPSKDGTKVPMFITAKKGRPRDGTNPTLLTGYGGFGQSMTPRYRSELIAWMERGGVIALANLRGGGEYGEAWHQAAVRTKRQVVYDDFIAAAEYLARERYTSAEHLGIFGTSGGGLLVAAVTMQRPELFGAVVPLAGPHDMLRFQLFGEGAGWQSEMGSPGIAEEFRSILGWSPLHNVRAGTHYPPMLIVTGDHDVRVTPLHSYKLAAALQAAQTGDAPVLLRVRTTSGHGGATRKSAQIDDAAERLTFFAQHLGMAP